LAFSFIGPPPAVLCTLSLHDALPISAAEPPAAEPSAGDAGRRGKPKRRRFNFNVLESLEKIVQSKTSEPAATTGWTPPVAGTPVDRKSTRLNSSHLVISYAVFCLKKK